MEKRRKTKKIFSLFSCFLFLCVTLVGFIPSASAVSFINQPGSPLHPAYSIIPFDLMYLPTMDSYTITNPLFCIGVDDDKNDFSWTQSANLDAAWVLSRPQNLIDLGNGCYSSTIKLTGPFTSPASLDFAFSTSRPFLINKGAFDFFDDGFKIRFLPQHELYVSLEMKGKYLRPDESGRGYDLVDFYAYAESTRVNTGSSSIVETNLLPNVNNSETFTKLWRDAGGRHIIVESCYFIVSATAFPDAIIDYGYDQGVIITSRFLTPEYTASPVDLFNMYPNIDYKYIDTGSPVQFLTALKTGLGGFLGTEIIPGISFSGLLSVALGISLIFVFLKYFRS